MTSIYGLCDPLTAALRYVGKTTQPLKQRLYRHCAAASAPKTRCASWIKGLLDCGRRPEVFEIEAVAQGWEAAEQFWIGYFKTIGADLTNLTAGGVGLPEFAHSTGTRVKLAKAFRGRIVPQERRERIAATLRGRKLSAEVVQRVSAALKGKKKPARTEEHARRISLAKLGHQQSEETKLKRSLAMRGRVFTAEHRAKLSEASYRRYAKAA